MKQMCVMGLHYLSEGFALNYLLFILEESEREDKVEQGISALIGMFKYCQDLLNLLSRILHYYVLFIEYLNNNIEEKCC